MTELALGARIGPYTLVRRIGEGGMGVVYECTQDGAPQAIALKLLRPELAQNDSYRRRFQHELRAASEVGHPGLVLASSAQAGDDLTVRVESFDADKARFSATVV